ncbi:MAG: DUF4440 domain-containing protein [Planctomycetaceae bacterium]|nr:DUF4440 domain-containing protein [Planctomycetaceae bacterium]
MSSPEQQLLDLSAQLLQAIDAGNWDAYTKLCDPRISCFEPEAEGHLVVGLPFHKFYFDLPPSGRKQLSSISSPHVEVIGDVGLVYYVRLVQKTTDAGPITVSSNETRVWKREGGTWRHIHFHRSPC